MKKFLKKGYKNILKSLMTIHGINYINNLKGIKKIVWVLVMLANVAFALTILQRLKQRYNDDQIVTQIYADCKVRDVPFPAVTICNFSVASKREMANIVRILKTEKIPEQEIQNFLRDTQHLKTFGASSANLPTYEKITAILRHHYFNMENLMESIHQKCEDLLVYCEYNGKKRDCDNMFALIQSYEGHCCAFNYAALDKDDASLSEGRDQDYEYYFDQSEDEWEVTNIIATARSGRSSGLKVVIDLEPDDYPSWSYIPSYGAKILISDPNDYPETTVRYKYVQLEESLSIEVEPLVYYSDYGLRKIIPSKRGCLFNDEVLLSNTVRYSYETCNTECKMKKYLVNCGCVPYFYPKGEHHVCELKDLQCLRNVTVQWYKNVEECDPPCFFECKDKGYAINSNKLPFWKDEFPAEVLKDRNISHLSSIQVYYAKSTCNCYRQSLVIDFNFIIGNYGGILSFSFGISQLTIVEIVFFILSTIFKLLLPCCFNVKRK